VRQAFDARGNASANVLATKRGAVDPDLVYVVSSHFDSVASGPGADDDTSGTAALLETARILADTTLPTTIIFASFTGEEAGLLGSREFVRQAADANLHVVGALNNDMIGWGADRARADNTIQHGAAFLFTDLVTYDAKYYRSTDAAAFYEAWGDIVGGIGSYPVLANPNYHQATDLLETMNFTQILETAKVTAATIIHLASSPSRLTGLAVERSGQDVRVRWQPAVESGVGRYVVAYGPADDPLATRVTVTEPAATLPALPAGTHIAVKAVNDRNLEGWDWARIVVQ
jgi:Zn-dependent M28 family amino/carboxypeptidase